MTTDPRDALPPRLDPACTCVCHSQPGVMHVAPCCREADPRDAEIARLRMALAESEAAAEGALMILAQTQTDYANLLRGFADLEVSYTQLEIERDAALAQVALLPLADLLEAARELAGYASYAEIVGGLSVNKPQVRGWDKVFEIIRSLPVDQDFEPTTDTLTALSRRDAQMRAEGMRKALDVASENADWPEDEHGRTEHPALFARISHAILAAAEKEAQG